MRYVIWTGGKADLQRYKSRLSYPGYLSVLTCVGLCSQSPAAGWGQAYGRQNTLRTDRPILRHVKNKEFMRKAEVTDVKKGEGAERCQ